MNVVIGVEDLDGVIEHIIQEEGNIVKPKTSAREMDFFAIFQDCFGNKLCFFSVEK